jgi:enoyl-CoA hydratase/carnithine racemase
VSDDVLISVEGGVGRIRLNRPKAIHALTTRMCEVMSEALLQWRSDPSVVVVIIDHAEGRGFCAGGDVVMLWRSGNEDGEDAKRFFFAEYRLNHLLFTYPKPTIADNLPAITRCFASYRLEDVIEALKSDESDWAATELATLQSKSPLSCKVSLRLVEEGANRASFEDEMRAEYALASRVVRTHDFREGVRALLIEKDNSPQWDPPTPEGVDQEMLDVLFEPLHGSEAWTPFPETQQ